MRLDIVPDVLFGPGCQWIDFDEAPMFVVAFNLADSGASRRLVTAQPSYPSVQRAEDSAQGEDFTYLATEQPQWHGVIKKIHAVPVHDAFNLPGFRAIDLDLDAILFSYPIEEDISFLR
jgi:hypothetical protein